jgi:hypothetical protein
VENVKGAAAKVGKPAVALGATAVGIAGGVAIKNRLRRKTILGIPVPRSIAKPRLSDLDVKSVAKSVGQVSKQFGKTTKNVSKDMERVGDQVERIGKILS